MNITQIGTRHKSRRKKIIKIRFLALQQEEETVKRKRKKPKKGKERKESSVPIEHHGKRLEIVGILQEDLEFGGPPGGRKPHGRCPRHPIL